MKKCPYCGSIVGLFSKETVKFDQYYKFTGEVNGYGDRAGYTSQSKRS